MGAVYLARELAAERLVAMKFLHHPGSSSAYDRFLVELRAFAKLDHPNVVRVLGSDFLRADPYFTMEYLSGGSLANGMESNGRYDPTAAARLIASVARGVHAANRAGVVHRDLKPTNILVGPDGVPKVADFGLAKRTDRDDGLTTATGPLGTPGYMAPEQTGGSSVAVGPPADVYGLGATLYHMVTGRAPFRGPQPGILNAVLNDPPPRPRAICSMIPRGLEAIVLKCLEKFPARRYQSAAELAADLDRFLAGVRPAAPEITWLRQAAQRLQRNRRWVASRASAVFAVAVVVLIGSANTPAPLPIDAATAIRREVKAGLAASLFKDNQPRHAKWLFGQGQEYPRTAESPEYGFFARNYTLLELCPDPGLDSYRYSAKIRHTASTPGQFNSFTCRVGMLFNYETRPAADQVTVHAFRGVVFTDHQPGGQPVQKLVSAQHWSLFDRLLDGPRTLHSGFGSTFIKPVDRLPGPWRDVVAEVSPGRTVVWFDGELVADTSRPGYEMIDQNYLEQFDVFNVGGPYPTFPPRGPLGVFVIGAGVSIKEAVITPLR